MRNLDLAEQSGCRVADPLPTGNPTPQLPQRRSFPVPPLISLLLLTLLCLLPFIQKAFFIDDTLFLRAAEQIHRNPVDFYGFNINWFGYTTPMTEAFENPPLTSYFIALVALAGGWSEVALHGWFLLVALATAWGMYELAKAYCDRPFLAAVLAVLTPAFLVSATTVMCDVMLVGFWVWAVVLFERGMRGGGVVNFLGSGCLAGLAVLTKFPGLALVPLLAAYGLACGLKRMVRPSTARDLEGRPPGGEPSRRGLVGLWLLAPLLPLVFAAGYEGVTHHLYGHGLLSSAAGYASKFRADAQDSAWEKSVLGLCYAGGCFLPVMFFAPWLWPRRTLLGGLCCLAGCLLFLPRMAAFVKWMWRPDGGLNWSFFLFSAVLFVGGLQIVALAVVDLWRRRDAVSLLLLLWLAGVMVFTTAVNWTINARSLLPAIPVAGLLVARRLDALAKTSRAFGPGVLAMPVVAAGVMGLCLAKADFDLANTHRTAVRQLFAQYQGSSGVLWFQGHWGIQYYFEQLGAKAMEIRRPRLNPGDIVILPIESKELRVRSDDDLRLVEVRRFPSKMPLTTMSYDDGAGFYASVSSPLPFVIGAISPESFTVYEVLKAGAVPR